MKTTTCSFCGEQLVSLNVEQGEEHFCSSRHRNSWNQRSESFHDLVRLQQKTVSVLSTGRGHFADQHYG